MGEWGNEGVGKEAMRHPVFRIEHIVYRERINDIRMIM